MLKKIDWGKQFVTENSPLFLCPLCQNPMGASANGLKCENNHHFDVSKKGTLYFLQKNITSGYDRRLFTARRQLIQAGMYDGLLDKLREYIPQNTTVLDVGCGEGSFFNKIATDKNITGVGFDIAKDGVYMATEQTEPLFWCIADLTRLPFSHQVFDIVLNLFTPSNYKEFKRVLKPSGTLVKVVPRSGYLQELRQAFYPTNQKKQHYENYEVIQHFEEQFKLVNHHEITYTFDILPKNQAALLEMSPLEWGVSAEQKEIVAKNPLNKITIDLDVLIGKEK
ncbi:50S rRNA methyltransferase [Enterococcus saigonensis]|uniref:50S rRNA methyltransferase n=1 Tax=Enterococcus saigonensis TaxID=1805431 RepID=A0A679IDL2_9ENTE|nr:methyltransferase domain-containing protein [Enterococcus saigonensis]BCA86410.1 50S rRNA methyltransferase [Enterococcus saigonensis]